MMNRSRAILLSAALMSLMAGRAHAQWVQQQTQVLHPGWNAVFLEVDPVPSDPDLLFDSAVVEAVWTLDLPSANPDAPVRESYWRFWAPEGAPGREVRDLFEIRGDRVYLIKFIGGAAGEPCFPGVCESDLCDGGPSPGAACVDDGDCACPPNPNILTFLGRPASGKTTYIPGFNLVGFHVVDNPSPTFQDYLSPSAAHQTTRVFPAEVGGQLLGSLPAATAALSEIPLTTAIIPPFGTPFSTGFWVRSTQSVVYDGPIDIDTAALRGVDYHRSIVSLDVKLRNRRTTAEQIVASYVPSAPPPPNTPSFPPSGPSQAPLQWLQYGSGVISQSNLREQLMNFPTNPAWMLSPSPQQTASKTFSVYIDRNGLPEALLAPDGTGSQYQGILQLRSSGGFRRLLPVAAQATGKAGGLIRGGGMPPGPPGLYVGLVRVNEVAWVTAGAEVWTNSDPSEPVFSQNRACFLGDKEGLPCDGDADCASDCENGTCDMVNSVCVGGPNDGQICADNSECACPPGGDGVCSYYCFGGVRNGEPCDTSDDCPGGSCSIDTLGSDTDKIALRPTAQEFQFAVVVHMSDSGQYTLLRSVRIFFKPGETENDIGRYVLVTPTCPAGCCDNLEAGSTIAGEPFARRVSTAAFSFDGDVPLDISTGPPPDLATQLAALVVLPASHPRNPFFHRFHPDHDGREEAFTDANGNGRYDSGESFVDTNGNSVWDEGDSFRITRSLQFVFDTAPPEAMPQNGWGDRILTGTYNEKVVGLYKTDFDPDAENNPDGINARGTFILRRVSDVAVLNDGHTEACNE